MAGHSHSANIARRKGLVDAKRSKQFSKLARAIIVAARHGGGDPNANLDLKYAIDRAKAVSLPKDTIERAIKRGTGELTDGNQLESAVYEAVGPNGTFFLIEILTDNRNRTAPQIRKILERRNAHLGTCAWAFERKGIVLVPKSAVAEDALMDIVVEAGAEDMTQSGDYFEITAAPADFEPVRSALVAKEIAIEDASLVQTPTTAVPVDEDAGAKLMQLIEELDDHDDVQNVYTNIEFPDSLLAKREG